LGQLEQKILIRMENIMELIIWGAAIFLIALTIYIKIATAKASYYVGIGGKHYNKPIPDAMSRDQQEIYGQIYRSQKDKGLSSSAASNYAIRMVASLDPSPYGLKEKPFRGGK